jgi:lysozyme
MRKNKYIFCIACLLLILFAGCGKKTVHFDGGVYKGETDGDLPSGYGLWTRSSDSSMYRGFWAEGKKNGTGVLRKGNYCYRGEFANDRYSGYGELTYKDSVVYSGEWENGHRSGKGLMTDSAGRKIFGYWSADTIIEGKRTDSTGVYVGQFNRKGMAEGHGYYLSSDGTYYEGHWVNGKRSIFGFAIAPGRSVRAGEWRNDRFLGERVVYSNDRIYGIDISRYQHGSGRKKYGIDWRNLRITHLGTISRKKVSGNVNYPISFVYIKSTQGTTIRNKYYKGDYLQARRHGIHVGSYHFFSTVSNASRQAMFFLKHSSFRKGDFPPVLDVEPTHRQIEKMGGVNAMFNSIRAWMRIVGSRTGTRPILYVSQTFVNRYLPSAPDIKRKYLVWIARYGEYKPDVKLVYWQLCPDGRVRGIKGEVDINVFNGYRVQFDEFLQKERIGK